MKNIIDLSKKLLHSILMTFFLSFLTVTNAQELKNLNLKVLGTWSSLDQFKKYEKPFWTETLPKNSNGAIKGEIFSMSIMGLKGYEALNLVKNGVFDVANMVVAYVTGSTPEMEGIDLSGIAVNVNSAKKYSKVYKDVVNKSLAREGLRMIASYSFGSGHIFCKEPFNSLSDLKGRKTRTSSATHADFLSGLGAVSVTISFGEVIPAIQKGVVDCAVTSLFPAYQSKWHEVIKYVYDLPLNMGLSGVYVNAKKWDKLDSKQKVFLEEQIANWEEQTWDAIEKSDRIALGCLTGDSNCSVGKPHTMKIIKHSADDLQKSKEIVNNHVFPSWLKRCKNRDCKTAFNSTIGKLSGVAIK